MAFDRNALKTGLQNATQHSGDTKDDGASSGKFYLGTPPRPRFRFPQGTVIFDVIPWVATGGFVDGYNAGQPQYVLDLLVHMNVGPMNESVICPSKTLGKPCPICMDYEARKRQGQAWETIKLIAPKRRVIYNIWVRDTTKEQENKGVQVLEMAHYSIEEPLITLSRDPITREYTIFSDPDQGCHICLERTGDNKQTRYKGLRLLPRNAPIPDAILAEAVPLDSLVQCLSYEEIKNKYDAGEFEQGPDNYNGWTEPATSKYDITQQSAPSAPVAPTSVYGGTPTPATPPAMAPTAPVQAPTLVPQPSAPTKVATAQDISNKCPWGSYGGVFGVSLDSFTQCTSCALWNDCALEHDKAKPAFPSEASSMDVIPF